MLLGFDMVGLIKRLKVIGGVKEPAKFVADKIFVFLRQINRDQVGDNHATQSDRMAQVAQFPGYGYGADASSNSLPFPFKQGQQFCRAGNLNAVSFIDGLDNILNSFEDTHLALG